MTMAIAQKPKASEAAVDQLISGGLDKPASAPAAAPTGIKAHPLRFPADGKLYQRLETALNAADVKPPRNTYILNAIAEKLARDGY